MGGRGSGPWRGDRRSGKPTANGFCLDARRWHREGLFAGGRRYGTWTWSSGDEVVASISYEATREAVTLDYKADGEPRRYAVPLDWTPCTYGGFRPWFRCPSHGCGRRCAVLHFGGARGFACRQCCGLVYPSQNENRADRLMRKADRIRARLGAERGDDIEQKPRGMHWRTFERLMDEMNELDSESLISAVARFGIVP